ncbi:hypothetical protein QKW52_13790 [Bacillus sonorensis]|nr:hypothetical protein [Bacillus sonorensis]
MLLVIIGIMFLGGALPFLIGIALAAVMIYFGWTMIKQGGKKKKTSIPQKAASLRLQDMTRALMQNGKTF